MMMYAAAANSVHYYSASPPSSSTFSSPNPRTINLLFPRCKNQQYYSDSSSQFVGYIATCRSRSSRLEAISKSSSKTSETQEEEKSDTYSNTMTEAMGADLTYRHELGMNYNFILPDLIVGSCLQSPEDVDKLRNIGVGTIFCLQQDPDLQYFEVDIVAIQEYAKKFDDIEHIRAEIRDFDGFDLRMRLPGVVRILHKAIKRNGGVTYIHCTAGMGRAPAVALAYMYWVRGYELNEAHKLLLSKRSCCPKVDAIKSATADINAFYHLFIMLLFNNNHWEARFLTDLKLTGLKKQPSTFKWVGQNCSLVEISGLDVGWGQKIPLEFDEGQGSWILNRELPEGRFEYKYIVDGEWLCNAHELVTFRDNDGNINNYVVISADDAESDSANLRQQLTGENPDLTADERLKIMHFLEDNTCDQ